MKYAFCRVCGEVETVGNNVGMISHVHGSNERLLPITKDLYAITQMKKEYDEMKKGNFSKPG